jgi:phospholipase/carboxylesterase
MSGYLGSIRQPITGGMAPASASPCTPPGPPPLLPVTSTPRQKSPATGRTVRRIVRGQGPLLLRGPSGARLIHRGRSNAAPLDAAAWLQHHEPMTTVDSLDGPLALPASGGDPQSLVIFLHGYGSNGDDLIGLAPYWQAALPDTLFIAPNAPQPCPGAPGGYQWWPLTSLAPEARAAGVRQPAAALNAFIDNQLKRYALTEDRLALVGFSQGAMVALHVGPRRERRLAGIVGYSGMLADPTALAAEVRTKPQVLLVHGEDDAVLPVAALHEAELALSALHFGISTHVSAGLGHSIDEAGLRLGEQLLSEVLL